MAKIQHRVYITEVLSKNDIEIYINNIMEMELNKFFGEVPYARHLTDKSEPLNEEYYIRHRIETVKRIHMISVTDALSLAHMIEEDYNAARLWAKYIVQEMNHDKMFIADLQKHGVSEKKVWDAIPFKATENMLVFLKDQIDKMGSLPAVAYSLVVEWNADRCASQVVDKVSRTYTPDHVRGARTHVDFDHNHDHYQVILNIVYDLICNEKNTSHNHFIGTDNDKKDSLKKIA